MRRIVHPRRSRLRTWLEHGDPRIDAHLDTCERCAARLENLSEPTTPLADALRSMLAPPSDLQEKLLVGINSKLQRRADLELLAELMGLPVQTARALAEPPPPPRPES